MTLAEKLLTTIVAGILLWMIKDSVLYLIQRRRIRAALSTEVSFFVGAIREVKKYLEDSFDTTFALGKEVEYSATYTPEKFYVYKQYSSVLTTYLGKRDLIRTVKFYRAIHEFETLCAGVFSDLDYWKTQKHTLTEADILYLGRKKARILSIASIVTERHVKNISDLPEDYKGQLDAGSIVR